MRRDPVRHSHPGRSSPVLLRAAPWLLALISATWSMGTMAQEPAEEVYRRVYVPKEEMEEFKEVYLPISRREFERRVERWSELETMQESFR